MMSSLPRCPFHGVLVASNESLKKVLGLDRQGSPLCAFTSLYAFSAFKQSQVHALNIRCAHDAQKVSNRVYERSVRSFH